MDMANITDMIDHTVMATVHLKEHTSLIKTAITLLPLHISNRMELVMCHTNMEVMVMAQEDTAAGELAMVEEEEGIADEQGAVVGDLAMVLEERDIGDKL
jgi:hypothetical protein